MLNDRQLAVLGWIADGCPDGVYDGEGHKVSAATPTSQRVRMRLDGLAI